MKKIIIGLVFLSLISLAGCGNPENTDTTKKENKNDNTSIQEQSEKEKTEKIKIVLFHGTQRCHSCNMMEKLIKETLKENFEKEFNSGKITLKTLNGELPENRDIVKKYGATGLSVFINSIKNGKDNIQEKRDLWRYIQNETKFKKRLTEQLENLQS